jgi:hypothetical protein
MPLVSLFGRRLPPLFAGDITLAVGGIGALVGSTTRALIVSALAATVAHAGTIVSTLGVSNGGVGNSVLAVSWTQTQSYSNVSVMADIAGTGTAWLTTATGPSATPAQALATVPLPGNFVSPNQPTVLFSGLDLSPGTYYLVASLHSSGPGVYWSTEPLRDPTVVTAPGVSLGPSLFGGDLIFPTYGPSASFSSIGIDRFQFSVDSAPEPSTVTLTASGFILFL